MKILIATGLYAPEIGGPATYTSFLERHLPQRGFQLSVTPFAHVRKYPKLIRHFVYTYRILINAKDADIIYALDTVSVGVPALIASSVLRKPLFLRVPGDYAWEQGQQRFGIHETLDAYLEKGTRHPMVIALSLLQRLVAKRALRVIAPSEYIKMVVRKWGVDDTKIITIYSAYNPVEVTGSRESLRARYGHEGFVVITAARLVPWKGIDNLIDAIVHLRDSGTHVTLEIVGEGSYRPQLESRILDRHANEYIHLRGRVGKTELAERLKAADAFVLNTSYEGLSHQLLEVMDVGLPIITTPVGGNIELIQNDVNGLLVQYNDTEGLIDSLKNIHADTALRTRLVENGRERVKDFREEKIVEDIVTILNKPL